jgi:stearoyl-CoA desaturase (delta-9 desaturase)
MVEDIACDVNWLNRCHVWYLPYLVHGALAALIGFTCHAWLLAAFYWLGMMSHPIQGWMVNALAHRFGYRNFDIPDNSRNNHFVAWLVFGEGYQNNHHFRQKSADFSHLMHEIDLGYLTCRIFSAMRLLKLNHFNRIAA